MRPYARPALLTAGFAGATALALVAPENIVMRLVFGKLDDPALVRQLLLTALGVLLALATVRYGTRPRARALSRERGAVRPGRWARAATWAAAGVPVLGFSVPHLLWGLGVPFGVAGPSTAGLAELHGSPVYWGLLVAGPVAGGLLTLGLISRWGQIVPRWVPWAGGRRVPTSLAVVPAVTVGLLVGQYGAMMTSCLAFGITRTCAPGGGAEVLDGSWAFAGTYPVFLAWGVCLLGAAVGYIHTRRSWSGGVGGRGLPAERQTVLVGEGPPAQAVAEAVQGALVNEGKGSVEIHAHAADRVDQLVVRLGRRHTVGRAVAVRA
ncbi:hypothetical protein [Nonomuraea diastatica]|uniref:Uncharacterized protein n=1 Tax=Nonomuraea diastatica TaxID=1848329 RepID=A0A4R4W8I4_9ACTN|nr:hypothetical protein [Nonomuraea diastatica]TDD15048.1 hypothetical protein E1294_35630 [Nonomuraea diastatica]